MHEPLSTGIRVEGGVVNFPVHLMRGGTSTGLVIDERYTPKLKAEYPCWCGAPDCLSLIHI